VDLAYLTPGTEIALAGKPVYAVLEGQVAGVILDRFPYGNAVLVETRLEDLPPGLAELPAGPGNPEVLSALSCPESIIDLPAGGGQSVYTLYAHLEAEPELRPEDEVACGTPLGKTGASGNALNPHLHLEMRLGPSGMRFGSMAHYDASASELEMALYCLWRVSGQFVLVDPMEVLR
jgi:murein DD-endopeptidase MepM/ murein hydrolase activator NlpD